MDSLITPALTERLERLRDDETAIFNESIPRSRAWLEQASAVMPNGVPVSWMSGFWRHSPVVAVSGSGTTFTDLDGNTYRDFNLCDLAMAAGFAPPPVVEAISRQAALGNHFLLPTTDAYEVSQLLGRSLRSSPMAVHAVGVWCERRRPSTGPGVHRPATGRGLPGQVPRAHGRDAVVQGEPDGLGLPEGSGAHLTAVPFNDLAALEARWRMTTWRQSSWSRS